MTPQYYINMILECRSNIVVVQIWDLHDIHLYDFVFGLWRIDEEPQTNTIDKTYKSLKFVKFPIEEGSDPSWLFSRFLCN